MYILRCRGSFNNYVDKKKGRGSAKIPHLSTQEGGSLECSGGLKFEKNVCI